MNKNRLLSLDFSRGIAIILVVFAHVNILVMDASFSKENMKINYVIESFIMPLFFMISAAFLKKSIEKYQIGFFSLLIKLTTGILIPFYSLGIIFLIFRLISPQSVINKYSATDMIKALLINQYDIDKLPLGALWFLFSIFLFSLLIYLLIEILKINPYIIFTISIFLKLFHSYFDGIKLFGFGSIPFYFLFFVFGYIESKWVFEPKIPKPFLSFPILFLIWFLSFHYLYVYYHSLCHIICGFSASFLIIGLSEKINHNQNNPLLKIMYICGSNSMIIYVFHVPFLILIKKILQSIDLQGSFLGFGIAGIVGISLSLLFGIIISYFRILYIPLIGRPFVRVG